VKKDLKDIKKENIEYVLIVIDPADQGGDNYAALQCLIIGSHIFITDVIFNNYGTDINIGASVELAVNSKATAISIENNAGWGLAGKEIRRNLTNRLPNCEVRFVKEIKNKQTRILNNSAWIKNNIYFRNDYKNNKEYNAFINNVTSYLREGGNKHDDGPDALTMIAQYCDSNLSHLW
jgi:predicted phage terminase large subunit-like protein